MIDNAFSLLNVALTIGIVVSLLMALITFDPED